MRNIHSDPSRETQVTGQHTQRSRLHHGGVGREWYAGMNLSVYLSGARSERWVTMRRPKGRLKGDYKVRTYHPTIPLNMTRGMPDSEGPEHMYPQATRNILSAHNRLRANANPVTSGRVTVATPVRRGRLTNEYIIEYHPHGQSKLMRGRVMNMTQDEILNIREARAMRTANHLRNMSEMMKGTGLAQDDTDHWAHKI